jgi:hypothetical protein
VRRKTEHLISQIKISKREKKSNTNLNDCRDEPGELLRRATPSPCLAEISSVSPSPHITTSPMPMSTPHPRQKSNNTSSSAPPQLTTSRAANVDRDRSNRAGCQQDKTKKKRTPSSPSQKVRGPSLSKAVLGPACASARPDSLGRNQKAPLVPAVQRHDRAKLTGRFPCGRFFFLFLLHAWRRLMACSHSTSRNARPGGGLRDGTGRVVLG